MLPVVVEDDFDEGPPAQHDEDDAAAAAPVAIDSNLLPSASLDESAGTHTVLQDAVIAASVMPGSDALSAKEQRAAAKAEAAAARAAAKAVKEAEAAAKQCAVCGEMADSKWLFCTCSARSHIECLAKRFLRVHTSPKSTSPDYEQTELRRLQRVSLALSTHAFAAGDMHAAHQAATAS